MATKPANPSLVKLVYDRTQKTLFAMAVYRLREQPSPVLQELAKNGHGGGEIVARASEFVLKSRGFAAAGLKPHKS